MTREQLFREMSVGLTHSCLVDIREIPGVPGYIRTTIIQEGNRVRLEFDVWGMDEGGLYYQADFTSFDEMVRCLETFLNRPIEQWPEPEYPSQPSEAGTPESHRLFRELLQSGGPTLPPCGDFRVQPNYWQQFMPGASSGSEDAPLR